MANLSALNKIMKLQKLLLPLNCHSCSLQSTVAGSNALAVLLRQQSSTQQQTQQQQQHKVSSHRATTSTSRFYSSSSQPPISSTPSNAPATAAESIDDFRAREEQREQEFARQQSEAENAAKDDADAAKNAKVEALRQQILAAALVHVPSLGWTRSAIVKGAEDAGLPSVVHGMFPEGGYALVSYFNGQCNAALLQRLQQETQMGQREVSDPLDFLVRAVRARFEMLVPYKAQWPQAMALIALPQNASTALAQVLTLVDDICYFSGDRSVDFGWYTRRIGLATIMKMTELFMLQDTSPDHVKTWEFLKNRMDEAVQLQMMLAQTEDISNNFQRSFNSAFITARNILGLGYNR